MHSVKGKVSKSLNIQIGSQFSLLFAVVVLSLLCQSAFGQAISAEKQRKAVLVGADKATIERFNALNKSDHQFNLEDLQSPLASYRAVAELAIIQTALKLGGYPGKIQLEAMPNYARSLAQAEMGKIAIPSETLWLRDIRPEFFHKTSAIIRPREQEMGFMVSPQRVNELKIQAIADVKKLSSTVMDTWVMDVQALQGMGVEKIQYTSTIESMYRLVASGRADFLLWTFGANGDFGQQFGGIHLTPIEGVKIAIDESRHFVVSKKYPNSKTIFSALQKGLAEMREKKLIEAALIRSGAINPSVGDWKVIYPN